MRIKKASVRRNSIVQRYKSNTNSYGKKQTFTTTSGIFGFINTLHQGFWQKDIGNANKVHFSSKIAVKTRFCTPALLFNKKVRDLLERALGYFLKIILQLRLDNLLTQIFTTIKQLFLSIKPEQAKLVNKLAFLFRFFIFFIFFGMCQHWKWIDFLLNITLFPELGKYQKNGLVVGLKGTKYLNNYLSDSCVFLN